MPRPTARRRDPAHRRVALASAAALASGCSLVWPVAHGVGSDAGLAPVACVDGAFAYCQSVPHNAAGVPVIVNRTPSCPPLAPMPLNMTLGFDAGVPAGFAVRYGAAWSVDPNDPSNGGLYVFVEVDKATPLCAPVSQGTLGPADGDAVEIFVDDDGLFATAGQYDSAGTRQFFVSAPAADAGAGAAPVGSIGNGTLGVWSQWTSTGYQSFPGPHAGTSYRVVAYIQGRDLGLPANWTLQPGATIGLYVAVDIGEPSPTTGRCARTTQVELTEGDDAGCRYAARDTSCFCTPQLLP